MDNVIKEFPDKNERLKYSFVAALILEMLFLLLIAEISIIVQHFIKVRIKGKPLLISVVSMPKKKAAAKPKKKVVPVKKPVKSIKKIVKKVFIKRTIKPAPLNVLDASIPALSPVAMVSSLPSPVNEPAYGSGKKVPMSILDKYFAEIKAKIERNLIYPEYAKNEDMEGSVTVLFKILKNGDLVFDRVYKSSQYGILNDSAIRTIKAASPFMRFPKGIHSKSLTFLIKIHYKLNRM